MIWLSLCKLSSFGGPFLWIFSESPCEAYLQLILCAGGPVQGDFRAMKRRRSSWNLVDFLFRNLGSCRCGLRTSWCGSTTTTPAADLWWWREVQAAPAGAVFGFVVWGSWRVLVQMINSLKNCRKLRDIFSDVSGGNTWICFEPSLNEWLQRNQVGGSDTLVVLNISSSDQQSSIQVTDTFWHWFNWLVILCTSTAIM